MYSCPYCEGSKVSDDGKPTTARGIWKSGDLRTFGSIADHQQRWKDETNSNRKLLKKYKSCEFPPIKISNHLQDAQVLFTLPPDPLHNNLLGAGNDACDCLEKHFESEMSKTILKFYSENHFKNLTRDQEENSMALQSSISFRKRFCVI